MRRKVYKYMLFPTIVLFLLIIIVSYINMNNDQDQNIYFARSLVGEYLLKLSNFSSFLNENKILIVRNNSGSASNFSSIMQVFEFVVSNSEPVDGKGVPLESFENYMNRLFHSSETLNLSCGKLTYVFTNLIIQYFHVNPQHVRSVDMWSAIALQKASPEPEYKHLKGGHELCEVYFPEFGKWIAFDVYFGIIPEKDGMPLSIVEVSQLDLDEIDFMPLGDGSHGKTVRNSQNVRSIYQDARRIFGYQSSNDLKWHILFQHPKEYAEIFKENLFGATGHEAVIYTDASYFQRLTN